jgi:protein ImuA
LREVDAALGGGWPCASLIQISSDHLGLGVSLIVPLLASLTQAGQHVALIQAPFTPYAPALSARGVDLRYLLWLQPAREEDALWSVEQISRSGLVASVAYWGNALDGTCERRLQLAATEGDAIAFHFVRGSRNAHSYAAVRLEVSPASKGSISKS